MNFANRDIYNWPNLVSFIRILLAPVLLVLALNHQPVWFVLVLIFSEFTDVLDGFLARRLNQISALGSHLDSWGDFFIYSTLAISAWIMWPEIVRREWIYFLLIVFSFTAPVLVGLIKFRVLTSYHTWGVKLAVAVTVIAYVLLFMQWLDWPFRFAAIFCLLAAIEETAITLVMAEQHEDVRTIWQALRFNRMKKSGINREQ